MAEEADFASARVRGTCVLRALGLHRPERLGTLVVEGVKPQRP